MGNRYVKSDVNKKIVYIDANNLYGWAMSESLHYDDNKFDKNINLDISNTPDDSDIGYLVEVDSQYPDGKRRKQNISPFAQRRKLVPEINLVKIWIKWNQTIAHHRKIIWGWTDKKNYLI